MKNLRELPEELQKIIVNFVKKPEFLYFIDMLNWDDEEGLLGGGFAVMKDNTEIWKKEYKNLTISVWEYLNNVGYDGFNNPVLIRATVQESPAYVYDLSEMSEGEDYRKLTKEQVLEEIGHAIS